MGDGVVGKLSGERFLVPYLIAYPRWFVAVGSASSRTAFMFVMVQQAAGAGWREAAELYDLNSPPQILADLDFENMKASGYASPIPANDASLTTEPSALSAGYALYLNDHAQGPQQPNFLAGGYTTDYVKTDQQTATGAAAKGWKFTDTHAAVNEPTYALRLPNGGALVIFYTSATISWTAMSSSAVTSTGATGLPYSPPSQVLSQLGISAARRGLRVSVTAIDENLAVLGPAGAQGATIVVSDAKGITFAKS